MCISCVPQQDLCTFLISRACKNSTLANYLYWWVMQQGVSQFCSCMTNNNLPVPPTPYVKFKIKRKCWDIVFYYRYVIVECEDQDTQQRDPKTHDMYLNVMRRFSQALLKVPSQSEPTWLKTNWFDDIHYCSKESVWLCNVSKRHLLWSPRQHLLDQNTVNIWKYMKYYYNLK